MKLAFIITIPLLIFDIMLCIFALNLGDIKVASFAFVIALFSSMALFEISHEGGVKW